jgi:hypothetical protein
VKVAVYSGQDGRNERIEVTDLKQPERGPLLALERLLGHGDHEVMGFLCSCPDSAYRAKG